MCYLSTRPPIVQCESIVKQCVYQNDRCCGKNAREQAFPHMEMYI